MPARRRALQRLVSLIFLLPILLSLPTSSAQAGISGTARLRLLPPVPAGTGLRPPKAVLSSAIDDYDRALWNATVAQHLSYDLWTERDAYDATHVLMIPLHAAFERNEPTWQQQFAAEFQRFTVSGVGQMCFSHNRLTRLQFYYLVSQFIVLAQRTGHQALIPAGLVNALYDEVTNVWRYIPAWQYAQADFPGGVRERLQWKLDTLSVAKSYYRALIDEDFYLFALAGDLRTYERLSGTHHPRSPLVAEILDAAHRTFIQEVVWQGDGGWILQPGAWTDHADYQYAGWLTMTVGMPPNPVPGISPDSSHTHRLPLFLTSLVDAYPDDAPEKQTYEHLKRGLEQQFFTHVLVPPSAESPAYRLTNFMDGWNGVYRWGYVTLGGYQGYGPYRLSGTLTLGWWSFLDSTRSRDLYTQFAAQFPLSPEIRAAYNGPTSTRPIAPILYEPYTNGYKELLARLASKRTP